MYVYNNPTFPCSNFTTKSPFVLSSFLKLPDINTKKVKATRKYLSNLEKEKEIVTYLSIYSSVLSERWGEKQGCGHVDGLLLGRFVKEAS
jgi:hypothetical protein